MIPLCCLNTHEMFPEEYLYSCCFYRGSKGDIKVFGDLKKKKEMVIKNEIL